LDTGNDITRGDFKLEVDLFTAFEGTLAVHTDLAAASFNVVSQVVVFVIDFVDDVAACPRVSDLSDVFVLSVFNVGNGDFGSVTAVAGAFAWSVDEEERFVIEFLIIIVEVDLQLEWSAFTAQTLSSTEA